MKSIIFALIIVLANAQFNAQNTVTQNYCTSFIYQKLNDLIAIEAEDNCDFFQTNEIAFQKTKKDIFIQMKTDEEVGGKSLFFHTARQKKYIPKYDRIVLKELFKNIEK